MSALADKYDGEKDGLKRRILNQAGRELLLLESSDWPFLISTGQAKQYSAQRFNEHVARFYECIGLLKDLEEIKKEETRKEDIISKVEKIEQIDNVFPNIQFEYFKTYEYGPRK
jgi:1,4-alpha-glucan branching enzyme